MRRGPARAIPTIGLALLALLAFVVTACGSPAGSSPAGEGTASPESVPAAAPSNAPETLAPPSPAGGVLEDPALLAVLPADLGGVPVVLEPQAFAEAASDSAFATNVDAAAFGVVVDAEDLASAVVAQLAPDTFSAGFFRDWRDSYDEGACGQAGGVAATAETELGGRTVYITTCAGGLRTYHAWVEERGAVVSAFSLGERRFGEQLMAGLRP